MTEKYRSQFLLQARYNQWMNNKLYQVCEDIPDRLRKKEMKAFFKSIHGTFNHLLLGDRLWMGRFTGNEFKIKSLDQELYSSFDELWRERQKTDQHILDWIGSLEEMEFDKTIHFTAIVTQRSHYFRLADALSHFFHHQTHHRGQLTTLISQLDYDFGITDMMWMPGVELEQ